MGRGRAHLVNCFIPWNFVSSSGDRIEEAKANWRTGRMGPLDADNRGFARLP